MKTYFFAKVCLGRLVFSLYLSGKRKILSDFGIKLIRFHNDMKQLSEKKVDFTELQMSNTFDKTEIFGKFEKFKKKL